MKLYVPVRKNTAIRWWNLMTQNCEEVEGTNALWVKSITAFLRKKDAQQWVDDFNAKIKYPIDIVIVSFESK